MALMAKTANEILNTEYPAPKWAVTQIIPEGTTVFAAKPKMGKSMIMANIGCAIAFGGKALGHIKVERGGVLYVSLEDGERRLKSRLQQMGIEAHPLLENFRVLHTCPRMGSGGLRTIGETAVKIPNLRLVTIDTLQLFRPMPKNSARGYLYAEDYEQGNKIKKFFENLQTSALMIHHQRKAEADDIMDTLSGSNGLTGAADGILVLDRKNALDPKAFLHTTGKDIESGCYEMQFHPENFLWEFKGELQRSFTEQQKIIMLALRNAGPGVSMTPQNVVVATGLDLGYVKTTLRRLTDGGFIVNPKRGNYMYPV